MKIGQSTRISVFRRRTEKQNPMKEKSDFGNVQFEKQEMSNNDPKDIVSFSDGMP